jgi:hypothetical protein
VCFCTPCQKTAGPNGSYNLFIKEDKVSRPSLSQSDSIIIFHQLTVPIPQLKKLTGKSKPFSRKGDSGKDLNYDLCDTCGTIMWCTIGAWPGVYNIKAGTLDDPEYLEKNGKPLQEIYTRNRPSWCGEFQGAEQKSAA